MFNKYDDKPLVTYSTIRIANVQNFIPELFLFFYNKYWGIWMIRLPITCSEIFFGMACFVLLRVCRVNISNPTKVSENIDIWYVGMCEEEHCIFLTPNRKWRSLNRRHMSDNLSKYITDISNSELRYYNLIRTVASFGRNIDSNVEPSFVRFWYSFIASISWG